MLLPLRRCVVTILLTIPPLLPAQSPPATIVGQILLTREPAHWASPEAVLRDLQSNDDQRRLAALALIGLTDKQAHQLVWSQDASAHVVGTVVVRPSQLRLMYAALGDDATLQAILSLQIDAGTMTYVAIATPFAHGWRRIGAANCWCKYEPDPLAAFVQLHERFDHPTSGTQNFELALRASGGGTGIYEQTEARFRMHQGQLRLVMSFTSRKLSCDPTLAEPRCSLEKRWFYASHTESGAGAILVTGRGTFPSDKQPPALWSLRDVENRFLRLHCTSFLWNAQRFRYEKTPLNPNPCHMPLASDP